MRSTTFGNDVEFILLGTLTSLSGLLELMVNENKGLFASKGEVLKDYETRRKSMHDILKE